MKLLPKQTSEHIHSSAVHDNAAGKEILRVNKCPYAWSQGRKGGNQRAQQKRKTFCIVFWSQGLSKDTET